MCNTLQNRATLANECRAAFSGSPVASHPSSEFIVVDGIVRDAATGAEKFTLPGSDVRFADAQTLIVRGERTWIVDLATGGVVITLELPADDRILAVSPDRTTVVHYRAGTEIGVRLCRVK